MGWGLGNFTDDSDWLGWVRGNLSGCVFTSLLDKDTCVESVTQTKEFVQNYTLIVDQHINIVEFTIPVRITGSNILQYCSLCQFSQVCHGSSHTSNLSLLIHHHMRG